ncbi:HAD family hydrolase [Sulfolobus sp. A20]|uniref:HAD-IIA family hydrolase n=1 Tax=Sulfolobaceae TaxID=118883 RepID=UPI000846147B|nr:MULTISPECIES: HAD-IIA family hydrolase [unclassified Sulfolobus]TRM75671.1 HAD-IIA family hydrolase [Sulfolobus sp. E5]TRM79344.1 HAD-IIA family hydrolase [Sulfolobus sp. B5]TRM81321.1 HAD-IIA family hydrolase [Sulfolobus sp. D5]TRM82218.1 HAD-IIA family hydrolase [Sulfolobus sp. A20-N-F6]TRM98918.1 HAD-IIA family hydrolase [Sulfolobus sp. E1]TRN00362.1 HAD-IIA family hydrolase [Sulfolobus sp. F1]
MALVNDYELIISDIDGVVVREGEPIWENIKALRQLKDKGISIIFVTNNSGFSRVLLSRQLSYLGLNVTPNEIVTSGLAAAIYMKEKLKNIKRVFPVGEEGLTEELKIHGFTILNSAEAEENIPDAVVLGLDRLATYDKLSLAMRCISKGSKFIVTNMDRLWPAKDGLKLGAGSLASAIIYALKRDPDFIAGKPNPWIIEIAMKFSNIKQLSKVLVVGDQLETDIQMGNNIGADTVLVLTGISTRKDAENGNIKPKYVVNNLLELVQ